MASKPRLLARDRCRRNSDADRFGSARKREGRDRVSALWIRVLSCIQINGVRSPHVFIRAVECNRHWIAGTGERGGVNRSTERFLYRCLVGVDGKSFLVVNSDQASGCYSNPTRELDRVFGCECGNGFAGCGRLGDFADCSVAARVLAVEIEVAVAIKR